MREPAAGLVGTGGPKRPYTGAVSGTALLLLALAAPAVAAPASKPERLWNRHDRAGFELSGDGDLATAGHEMCLAALGHPCADSLG